MSDEIIISSLQINSDWVVLSKKDGVYFIEYHIKGEYDKLRSYPETALLEVVSKFADLCKVLEYS